MAQVERIFISLRHRLPMKEVEEVEAVLDHGLNGCAHGRRQSHRQVLLMDVETLDNFGILAGAVKENLTTRGLILRELKAGQRLQVGGALLEISLPCEPCGLMDDIRRGLQEELHGRRGMLCRVVGGGLIRRGDGIEVLPARAAELAATGRSSGQRTE